MSLTEPTLADPITPSAAWRQAAERQTPFGQYLGEKLLGGLEGMRPFSALEEAALPGRLHGDMATVIGAGTDEFGRQAPGMGRVGPDEGQPVMPKAEWEASPSYRPSLTWDEGMTPARAEALATQHDRLDWNKSLIARYQGGFTGEAAGFVAGLAPGVADPTNYIPLLGPAAKAAMVARLGVIGGNVGLHAAEAAANTALFEPLTASHAATFGQPYGWEDAAADVALGALAGAVGGAIHGGLEYRGSLREAATRTRLETVMAAADATSLAAEQHDRGLPVDVAPVLAGRLPEAPRPSTFDVGGIVPRRAGEARPPEGGAAPEHIAAAAVRVGDEVFAGADHGEAAQAAAAVHGEAAIDALPDTDHEALMGYVTSTGRWVPPAEAARIAAAADQVRPVEGMTRAESRAQVGRSADVSSEQLDMGRPGPGAAAPEGPHPAPPAPGGGNRLRLDETYPAEGGGEERTYALLGPSGDPLLDVVVHSRGAELRILDIVSRATDEEGPGAAHSVGLGSVRELAVLLAREFPEAERLTGERVSGGRFGGARVDEGRGKEAGVSLDLFRRRPPSFATAAPEPPHPAAAEAARRVGRAEADPLATFKADAGLEGYQQPLPGHEPEPEPVPGEPARPAKPERPPTREEKAAALAALPPELAEIEAMRREGSFTPGDEATLAAGEAEAQKAENFAAAWQTLATCVARNAA